MNNTRDELFVNTLRSQIVEVLTSSDTELWVNIDEPNFGSIVNQAADDIIKKFLLKMNIS